MRLRDEPGSRGTRLSSVKCSALALFIIGFLLEGVAFFSCQAENVTFVLELLSPSVFLCGVALHVLGFADQVGYDPSRRM